MVKINIGVNRKVKGRIEHRNVANVLIDKPESDPGFRKAVTAYLKARTPYGAWNLTGYALIDLPLDYIPFSKFPGAYSSWPDVVNLGPDKEPQVAQFPLVSPLRGGWVLYYGDNYGDVPGRLHSITLDTHEGQWSRTGKPAIIAAVLYQITGTITPVRLRALRFKKVS